MKRHEVREIAYDVLRNRWPDPMISCSSCGHLVLKKEAVMVEYVEQDHIPTIAPWPEFYGRGCAPHYEVVHYWLDGSKEPEYFQRKTLDGTKVSTLVKV